MGVSGARAGRSRELTPPRGPPESSLPPLDRCLWGGDKCQGAQYTIDIELFCFMSYFCRLSTRTGAGASGGSRYRTKVQTERYYGTYTTIEPLFGLVPVPLHGRTNDCPSDCPSSDPSCLSWAWTAKVDKDCLSPTWSHFFFPFPLNTT